MGVEALLQELLDGRDTVAERVVARSRREMPSYAGVPLAEHRQEVEAALELLVRMRMESPDPAVAAGAGMLRQVGERRARQGVPMDDLLRAWRMGVEEATAYAREIAPRTGSKPDELFDLFQQAFALVDEAVLSITGGYRRDPAQGDPEEGRRDALVRGALLGRLGSSELSSGFAGLGLAPLAGYRAFRSRGADPAALASLNGALESGAGAEGRDGLATTVEQHLAGFTCAELPRGEFELVAVGPSGSSAELPASYRTAGRVLAAAEGFGLVGVHDLASAGLLAAVIENPDLGAALSVELVEPVAAQQGGPDVLASVREWLLCGMRVEPAAERLFVHPNTVRYRLRRYEELTGAELRQTEDAFRVWWALQREHARAGDGASRPGKDEEIGQG